MALTPTDSSSAAVKSLLARWDSLETFVGTAGESKQNIEQETVEMIHTLYADLSQLVPKVPSHKIARVYEHHDNLKEQHEKYLKEKELSDTPLIPPQGIGPSIGQAISLPNLRAPKTKKVQKKVVVHAQSDPAVKFKPKGSSSKVGSHLLHHYQLYTEICKFAKSPSEFFLALKRLKQQNDALVFSLLPKLRFPEELCIQETVNSLNDYDTDSLDIGNPLFSSINQVISEISDLLKKGQCSSQTTPLLQEINDLYKNYIQQVCSSRGERRHSLLVGKVRIFIRDECHFLEQKIGREIACLDRYGYLDRDNAFGAGAVSHLGSAFFKRPWGLNPLMPSEEFAVHTLHSLLSDQIGITATQLIKIENLWVKSICSDESVSSKILQGLVADISNQVDDRLLVNKPGYLIQKVFETHPALEKEYPFLRKRVSHIMLSSYGIEGKNLKETLLAGQGKDLRIHPENFTALCILGFLTLPTDGRSDNFIVTPSKGNLSKVVGIDNDGVFSSAISITKQKPYLELKYSILLLPQMNMKIDENFVKKFLKTRPEDIFLNWLRALEIKEKEDLELLSLGIFDEEDYKKLYLPLKITPQALIALYLRLKQIHNFVRKKTEATHWELVSELFPVIAKIYQTLLQKTNNNIQEAENWLFDRRERPILLEEWIDDKSLLSKEALNLLYWDGKQEKLGQCIQKCLEIIPCSLNKMEQMLWIEKMFLLFPGQNTLILKNCLLEDLDWTRLFTLHQISLLSLEKCPFVTEIGLIPVLQHQKHIHLKIGLCPALSKKALKQLILVCQQKQHRVSLLVGDQEILLDRPLLQKNLEVCLEYEHLEYAEICMHLGARWDFIYDGGNLLHKFAEKKCPKSLSFLINHGLKTNSLNRFQQTPLHLAAQEGQKENVALLLQHKVEVDCRDSSERTPLFLATLRGHLEIVKLLTAQKADVLLIGSEAKETLVHVAAYYGQFDLLCYFFTLPQIQKLVDAQDSDGRTALHRAVNGNNDPRIVTLLLKHGFNPNAENSWGYLPIHFAAKEGREESVRVLLENQSKTYVRNKNGDLPFDLAIRHAQDSVVLLFLAPEKRLEVIPNPLPKDLEGYHYSCIGKAKKTGDFIAEILYLGKTSDFYLQKDAFIKAAQLANSALSIAYANKHLGSQNYLYSRLERIEGLYLNSLGIKVASDYRNYIKKCRERASKAFDDAKSTLKNTSDIQQATRKYTTDVKSILCAFIQDAVSLFGQPPCKYAFVVRGAMARQEMTFHSGIELMVMISQDDVEAQKYFSHLIQFLELRFVNMGEHESFTFRFLGIGAPGQLATALLEQIKQVYFSPDILDTLSVVTGDEKLLAAYQKIVNSKENGPLKTTAAFRMLAGHLKDLSLGIFSQQEVNNSFLKQFFASLQGIIGSLALLSNVENENTFEQIQKLKGLSKEGVGNLQETMRTVLRLKFEACLPNGKEKMDPLPAFRQVNKTVIPFLQRVQAFYIQKDRNVFKSQVFYEEHFTQPVLSGQLILPHNLLLQNDPEASAISHFLAVSHMADKDHKKALECFQNDLAISQVIFGECHPQIAAIYDRITDIHLILDDHENVIECQLKKLKIELVLERQTPTNLAKTYGIIAAAYFRLGNDEAALDNHLLALKAGALFITHPDLKSSYDLLYKLCIKLNRTCLAIEFFQKSFNISLLELGEDHPTIALSRIRLSQMHQKTKYYAGGLAEAEKAFFVLADFHKQPRTDLIKALQEVCNCLVQLLIIAPDRLEKIHNLATQFLLEDDPLLQQLVACKK